MRLKRQIDKAKNFSQKIFYTRKKMQSGGAEARFTTSLQCVLVTHPSIPSVFVDERASTPSKKGHLRISC